MSVADKIRGLLGTVRQLSAEFHGINEQLTATRTRRAWLDTAPRPRECLQGALDRWIDTECKARFDTQVRKLVEDLQTRPTMPLESYGGLDGKRDFYGALTSGFALQHLLRVSLKEELRRVLSSMDWPKECGPDAAARTKEKQRLDQRIKDLELEIEEVRTAADQAGVSL